MIWTIAAAVLLLVGLVVSQFSVKGERGQRVSLKPLGLPMAALGLAVVLLNCFTIVAPKNVGVQTSFGKPLGTLDNGFHLVAPWTDIEEFDGTVQPLKLSGDAEDNGEPITVRLASEATATVDVSLEWQLDGDADITQLYLDYREFDAIGSNVVRRRLSASLNEVFATYDPLKSLQEDGVSGQTLASLSDDVVRNMEASTPDGIKIRSLLISKIVFDKNVQSKIDQFLAALAETQIAQQRELTAEALRRANDKLAEANNTPGVLYQNCLDMVERLTKEGRALPAAFTCGPPTGTVVAVK